MNLFWKRVLVLGVLVGGIIVAGIPLWMDKQTETLVAAFVLAGGFLSLGGLVWGWFLLRCPHCGRLQSFRNWKAAYCPYCGEAIK